MPTEEFEHIERVTWEFASSTALVPWIPEVPAGVDGLSRLVQAGSAGVPSRLSDECRVGQVVGMTARIAVLSDLHGNSAATEAVLADIDRHRPDATYCLGDLVGYGAKPNETIELIRARHIPTIVGNYDDGVGFDRDDCGCAYKDKAEEARGQQSLLWTRRVTTDENKAYLRSLPFDCRFEAGGIRVRLVHRSPRRINEYLFEDRNPASLARIARSADAGILVFGHTHKPWHRAIAGVEMINAGSVGKPKDGDPRACWAHVTIGEDSRIAVEFHRVPYDIAAMAAAVRSEPDLPDQFATDIETGGRSAER